MELIICDDASTDESSRLIDDWLQKNQNLFDRTVYIKHQKNYNVTATLNELISECRGWLISPLASDDYYVNDGIRKRRDAMASNPQWIGGFSDGMAVGYRQQVYAESIISQSIIDKGKLNSKHIAKELIHKWSEPVNLQFWRKSAFKSHGGDYEFDPSLYSEDLDFALWAMSKSAFGYLNHICYAYRCRSWPQSYDMDPQKYSDISRCLSNRSQLYRGNIKSYMNNKALFYMAKANSDQEMEKKLSGIICFGIISSMQLLMAKTINSLRRFFL
jgi:glycosyltransferase involved in cell wall biosynthesis